MRKNKVKELWQQGKAPSIAVSGTDPFHAELLANLGYDVLWLDMQHGMTVGLEQVGQWLQAVSTTAAVPFVRVPWNEPEYMQFVLDAGAYGVIVPAVNNRVDAVKAGGACRYPPMGYRSGGPNRVKFYGGNDYMEHANEEIVCLVMIEDIKTVEHIEDMVGVPGVDGFYIGAANIANTMGIRHAAARTDAAHQKACQRVLDAARKNGLVAGIETRDIDDALERQAQGFMFCPAVHERLVLVDAAKAALQAVTKPAGK